MLFTILLIGTLVVATIGGMALVAERRARDRAWRQIAHERRWNVEHPRERRY